MRLLRRKMLRDLWHIRWRALAVALTVAAGVGVYAGVGMAIDTGYHTRDVLLDRMRFADLEVQFLPEDVANLPDLASVPGVLAVERRLLMPGNVSLLDGTRMSGVMVFLEAPQPTLDVLELLAGRPLATADFESAVIERSLAAYHGFKVGDRIRVQVGEKVYDSRVDGVVLSPEHLVTTANPDYLVPEKGSLGVVFTGLARVSDALGFTMVNDLLFRFAPGADPDTVRAAVVTRLAKLNLERVMLRREHFISRFIEVQMESFKLYTPSIILTLGLLSLVLTFITVNRLVLDQRQEIGALLALGYTRAELLLGYVRSGGVLGVLGGVLGAALSFVLRDLFAKPYGYSIGMPEVVTLVEPARVALGCAAAIVGTAFAASLPPWRMLRLTPQAIIREQVGGGAAFGRWLGPAAAPGGTPAPGRPSRSLPLPVRFGLRNMIRRRSRTLSTVLALGLSFGVPIAFTVSLTSSLETPAIEFAREGWDLTVDFLYPVFLDDLAPIRSLPGVVRVEPYFRRFAELGAHGRFVPALILGIDPSSTMRRSTITRGRPLGGAPGEVVVSYDLARTLGLEPGDPVTVRIRSQQEVTRRVAGISGDLIPSQIILPFREAQEITGFEDTGTGVFITTNGGNPGLVAALGGLEYAAKVTRKPDVVAAFRKLISGMMRLVYVSLGVSIFVSLLFIAMSVSLVVSERRAEYATFKCLGYGRGKLAAMVLVQTLGEGGLAALLSIPVGALLAVYLNARMTLAWHHVLNIFRPGDFALVLGVALALIPLAAYPAIRTLDRLAIVDALGIRKIG
jgi:putative ABC transport system permease protein